MSNSYNNSKAGRKGPITCQPTYNKVSVLYKLKG